MTDTVTISGLGHGGDGIAETEHGRVFVAHALPGEKVEIQRNGERATVVRVVDASPDRVAPPLPHMAVVGTYPLVHMADAAYRAWKTEQVRLAFAQRGIDAAVEPIVPIRGGTRRRAVFSAIRTGRGVAVGFHKRHSAEIVPIERCPVLSPDITAKMPGLREIAAIVLPEKRAARFSVLAADNGLDIAVTDSGKPSARTLAALGRFGTDLAIARLTVDGTEVFRNRLPELRAGPASLFPIPGGFVQAVASAEEALADVALKHVGTKGPFADLFAGIGTFTFRLAAHGQVIAVEGDAALVAALDTAMRHARGVKRVTARRRDLFANPLSPVELKGFAGVVFDPPAAGAKAQSEMLARSDVPRIAAISCNPATLARDARILIDGGYRLERVVPVDQFLYAAEIEAVATFTR